MTTEGEKSSYNEAEKKMERIHRSQQIINTCRLKLLYFDNKSGLYHFEITATELINLLMDVRGKMSNDEKKKTIEYREKLTDFFDHKVIFTNSISEGFGSSKGTKNLNIKNWKELRKLLFDLEDFIKDTMEIHGFASFNIEDDEGDTY